jgi:hypothetical protein
VLLNRSVTLGNIEFLNKPILNYAQMKEIFMPSLFNKHQLYESRSLIKALNFIASNKDECAKYLGCNHGRGLKGGHGLRPGYAST